MVGVLNLGYTLAHLGRRVGPGQQDSGNFPVILYAVKVENYSIGVSSEEGVKDFWIRTYV